MQAKRESSVLFSLNELREMEDQRQLEEKVNSEEHRREMLAKEAEEKRREEEVAENIAQLQHLRRQSRLDTEANLQLQAKVKHLESRPIREFAEPAALASNIEFPIVPTRGHHLRWASALVIACVGVYFLAQRGQAPAQRMIATQPPMNVAAAPVAIPCENDSIPEPAIVQTIVPVAESDAAVRTQPQGKSGRGSGRKPPKESRHAGDTLDISVCAHSKDPLCGLDEI